ncbi:MAG TPA: Nramp family divalent metal transporter [Thermoanaerobaculia bacterium]|nr:Nramp family divalent metal transporter [Thermoanaerobaculia bacterium]
MQSSGELQIGVSRPPLPLADLPTPEEVFGVPRFDAWTVIRYVLGPSTIALGVAIGSGEWLLGPLGFATYGFMGLGFVVTMSAVLQTFYNIENARYTMATGEVPAIGFARMPPGVRFWVPLTFALMCLVWLWGGWAATAGQSIFALFAGRTFDRGSPQELLEVRFIGVGLLVLSLVIYLFGRKIARTLELIETVTLFFILASVVVLAIVFAPAALWGTMLASAVTPAAPPRGIDATALGAIVGFTGSGSGMNFMLVNYYRDHGYGMGHRVGFLSGLIGGRKQDVLPSGVTFRETEANARTWRRWFRYLVIDQWAVFFSGAMVGMFVPSVLAVSLATAPGAAKPTTANMPVFVAAELGRSAPWLFTFTLLLGALLLWKTQTTILEMLVRNMTDVALSVSPRLRAWIGHDPRKFYYLMAVVLVTVIGVLMFQALPTQLLQVSANLTNLAAMIFPFVLIYLNRRLPRPARAPWWSYVVLLANVLFFGFFFVNFLAVQLTGTPLVVF